LQEAAGAAFDAQQAANFVLQVRVALASLAQEGFQTVGWEVDARVQDSLDLFPATGVHRQDIL
jgi:hypothetical protein